MKPAQFDYHDPRTLDETVGLLGEFGDDAKLIAGGQSLMPLLNFRMARPDVLIDLGRVAELAYLRKRDGRLEIGTMCRQARAERSPVVAQGWPLLVEALEFVAHPQIRNRGTIGGSAAHADPAAEIPVTLACLDAVFITRSASGRRRLSADEFFVTHLTSALVAEEMLVEVQVPQMPSASRYAFCEHAIRHGDFALGGASVRFGVDDEGCCRDVGIALLGAGEVPLRAHAAEVALAGQEFHESLAGHVAEIAVREIQPIGDAQASTEYRRRIIEVMVQRALSRAWARPSIPADRREHRNGSRAHD